MKIRNGFVSNSSSSSFILAFKKLPQSVEELGDILFDDDSPDFFVGGGSLSSKKWALSRHEVASAIFKDMEAADIMPRAQMVEEGSEYIFDGGPDTDWFRFPTKEVPAWVLSDNDLNSCLVPIDWDAYNKASREHSRKICSEFADETPGCVYVKLQYGNEIGMIEAFLEDEEIFRKIKHLFICQH